MITVILLKLALLAALAFNVALLVALGFERARRLLVEDLLDARDRLESQPACAYGGVMKAKKNPKANHPESLYAIGELVKVLPEWQDEGDEGVVWEVMSEDEGMGRLDISPVDWKDNGSFTIRPETRVEVDMIERA